ncbi:MAG: hypothetical protein ACR2FI_11405, partial [Burkholderiales bacterium]
MLQRIRVERHDAGNQNKAGKRGMDSFPAQALILIRPERQLKVDLEARLHPVRPGNGIPFAKASRCDLRNRYRYCPINPSVQELSERKPAQSDAVRLAIAHRGQFLANKGV